MPLMFEQQPKESAKAFAAFKAYLDMGSERSLALVAVKLGKSKVLMERWSRKHDWCNRVSAHAGYVAERERLAIESVAREKAVEWGNLTEPVRRKAWQEGMDLINLTEDFKKRWRESDRVPGFESVVHGIELSLKLMQFAAGIPSEIKQVNTTIRATLDVDWENALRKVFGPPPPPPGAIVDVEALPLQEGEKL